MTSLYSQQHSQPSWSRMGGSSRVEDMMRAHQDHRPHRQTRGTGPGTEKVLSRIAFEQEQYEREMLNIRNFGYHWLKPIGISKTMGQIEDEAREVHESFEEYEDEDGEFNQNDPDALRGGAMDGLDGVSEEGRELGEGEEDEEEGEEEEDLDQEIEEGASFDVEDTSFVSSTGPITPAHTATGLYTTINGLPVCHI